VKKTDSSANNLPSRRVHRGDCGLTYCREVVSWNTQVCHEHNKLHMLSDSPVAATPVSNRMIRVSFINTMVSRFIRCISSYFLLY
jgi:hypothetical protein